MGVKIQVKVNYDFGVCLLFTEHVCDGLCLQESTARKLNSWLILGNKHANFLESVSQRK